MSGDSPKLSGQFLNGCYCRQLFELMSIGICITDFDGTIRFMNAAFGNGFNIHIESVVGRNICEFFPNSALLGVMRSGIPDRRVEFEYEGVKAFISRFPIYDEGIVVGGLIELYSRNVEELKRLLQHIHGLQQKVTFYKKKTQSLLGTEYTFDKMIGNSRPMQLLQQQAKRFARGREPILITGESGTGKELVAHAIHAFSSRAEEVFVRVNCAAIPAELIESELFGYEAGAFTGAKQSGRIGKFELADGGTIFLDEIGEMPLAMQAKLLRVLEHGEIQKIGRNETVFSDFRLLTATNRNLSEMVAQGRFRADLYHRLDILRLEIPPLRERTADLPALTAHLLGQVDQSAFQQGITIDGSVFEILRQYGWPGNIRELKNVLTFALYSLDTGGTVISARHLPPNVIEKSIASSKTKETTLHDTQMWTIREAITAALTRNKGNKSKAAHELGISRTALYKRLKKMSL
ncbi:sigma-54-dependent Fis family transcriptional regulator [uncultured Desulfovibrio sp.]|uniref:sigma-54 interaction domain-containing protein n=1 Tax=uncultured Desulfovibrio sp. TaxID=167968 RepID=UPI00267367AA|nr:sigma 54-interacting transcriptional regulator [uncultured Desulfovibrio sp.]